MEDKPFLHAFLLVFSWQPLATKYLFSCANVKDSLELPWLNELKVRAEVRIYWKQLLCMNLVDKCFVCFELLCSFYFLAIETCASESASQALNGHHACWTSSSILSVPISQVAQKSLNIFSKKNKWFMFNMVYHLMWFFSILLEALVDEHWKHSLSRLANLAFQR